MDLENLQFQIEEKVLEYILHDNEFSDEIKNAKRVFYSDDEENLEEVQNMDFNTWLIYDYRNRDDKTFLQELYLNNDQLSELEKEVLKKISNTYPSIYELKEFRGSKALIKDLFSRKEYEVKEERLKDLKFGDLIFSRIIPWNGTYKFVGNNIYLPGFFKSSIERNIIPRFERYINQNQFGAWDEFLDNNRLLLYKYVAIALDLAQNLNQEDYDVYKVWQSLYLLKDIMAVKYRLDELDFVQMDNEENGRYFFKIFQENRILAEIVLTSNMIELECNSEIDRQMAKSIINSELSELLTHYKDEVLTLDDII